MRGAVPPVGSLRERVRLETRAMTPMPDGGFETAYVPLATVWAKVRLRSGRMGERSDARAALASHEVVLRYRKDIAPGDRLRYRGRALEVVSAEDLNGRRAYLVCTCAQTRVTG